MSSNKTISISDEANDKIEQLRKEDSNFNLSGFLNDMIMAKVKSEENPEIIQNLILEKTKKIELLEVEIKGLQQRYEIAMKNKIEKELITKQENELKEKKDKEKKASIKKFFFDFVKREMTDDEYLEYTQGLENGLYPTLFSFIEKKELIKKPETKPISKPIKEEDIIFDDGIFDDLIK